MKTNSKELSPEQAESIKNAEIEREKALWKWQGEIVPIIHDFYTPFIENAPINDVEIETRKEILSIAGDFIEKMKNLASFEYDKAHHSQGLGYEAEKEITDKDELLSIKGILNELTILYDEYAHATAWQRDKVIEKTHWIKYLLSGWLYDQVSSKKKNCLNNYRNLYTIIETVNNFGEELHQRDFNRTDCMWFYGVLLSAANKEREMSDNNILSIFVAFINKNAKRDELYDNIANGNDDSKETLEESLKRVDGRDIFKLEKKNNSFEIIKTTE